MQQIETSKAHVLFVKIFDGVEQVGSVSSDNFTSLHYMVDGEWYGEKLPEGNWQFITLLKDAGEEHHKMISDEPSGLHSLANSLGVKGNCAVLVKNSR